jgi:hypothetical protein
MSCRTGCRTYETCPMGQVCDSAGLTCRGCSGDGECPGATPVCEDQRCIIACMGDSDCPLQSICNLDTRRCVEGCQENATDPIGSSPRCPPGLACLPDTQVGCQGPTCSGYDCEEMCDPTGNGNACADGANADYSCLVFPSIPQLGYCRVPCSSTADCPPGLVCHGNPSAQEQLFCDPRCGAALCAFAGSMTPGYTCQCDASSGLCIDNGGEPCLLVPF